MSLSPNKFEDNKDFFGFASEYFVDETEYLTVDKVVASEELITKLDFLLKDIAYPGTTKALPSARIIIELSDTKNTYKREPYTFFALLGDFGGFNGAIIMFPALLMSFYTPRMYAAAVAQETPIRKPQDRSSKEKMSQLAAQTKSAVESAQSPNGLHDSVLGLRIKQARKISRPKFSLTQLMCSSKCLCQRNQTSRLLNKINDRFEE